MRIIVVKEDMAGGRQTCFEHPYQTTRAARLDIVDDFYSNFPLVSREGHNMEVFYFENETQFRFMSTETGEIFADYFMLYVWF